MGLMKYVNTGGKTISKAKFPIPLITISSVIFIILTVGLTMASANEQIPVNDAGEQPYSDISPVYSQQAANASRNVSFSNTTLKTIVVAMGAPYTFINDSGLPDGFSVDLMRSVAQVMGFNIESREDIWDNARLALENGEIDFLPLVAYSRDREKVFDFTPPHTIAYDAFFRRKNSSGISSIGDLEGKTIIVLKNDLAHSYLLSVGLKKEQLIPVETLPEGLRLLASGMGDVAIMPKLVGLMFVRDLNLMNIDQSPVIVESYNRAFCFAVKKGDQEVLERLNQGLIIVKATGQYDEIYEKWFGTLEPKGLASTTVLKYLGGIILFFSLIGALLLLWSFSLRKQVALRTRSLESEMQERRLVEVSLRESEERFRSIVSTSKEWIWAIDSGGNHTFSNSAFENILGYRPDEIIGHNALSLLHEEDMQKVRQLMAQSIEQKTGWSNFVLRWKHRNGTWRYLESNAVPILDDTGFLTGFQGSDRDITERKRAEEELIKSRAMLMKAQELGRMGSWEWDLATNDFIWSKEVYTIYGLDPGIVAPKYDSVINALAPESKNDFLKAIDDAVKFQKPFDGEYIIIRPNGTRVYTHTKGEVVYDNKGDPVGMHGMVQDITERKRSEEDLRRINERFSLATNASRLGVWDWDIQKNELVWDDMMYVLFGIKKEDFAGVYEAWLKVVHPDDRARSDEISKLAQRGEREYDTEFRVVWQDGSIHHLKAYGKLVRDANGRPLRMTGINFDITERKRAEEELRKYREHLEELVKERTIELENKNAELEKFNNLFVGRELRMIELKKIIADYETKFSELEKEIRNLKLRQNLQDNQD